MGLVRGLNSAAPAPFILGKVISSPFQPCASAASPNVHLYLFGLLSAYPNGLEIE
jgi:hypothetical protein